MGLVLVQQFLGVIARAVSVQINRDGQRHRHAVVFIIEDAERRAQRIVEKESSDLRSIGSSDALSALERTKDQFTGWPGIISQIVKEFLQHLGRLLRSPRSPEKFAPNCFSIGREDLSQLVDVP